MKWLLRIGIALIVIAAFLLIFFHKRPQQNEIVAPIIDSADLYQAKKDSAFKAYLLSDSVRQSDITDLQRAEYKRFLIREILTRQRNPLREVETDTL